jgi:hypothetical protein
MAENKCLIEIRSNLIGIKLVKGIGTTTHKFQAVFRNTRTPPKNEVQTLS